MRAEHAPICVQHHDGRAFEPSYGCRGLAEVGMVQWARAVTLVKRIDPQRRHPCASRAQPVRRLHKRRVERAHVPRLRRRAKLFGTCDNGKLQVDEHRAFVHFQDLRSMRTRASARVQKKLAAPRLNGVGAANLRRKPAKVLARVRLEACRSVEHPCCLIDATAWSCRQQRHAVRHCGGR